jgi:hypothetical protein
VTGAQNGHKERQEIHAVLFQRVNQVAYEAVEVVGQRDHLLTVLGDPCQPSARSAPADTAAGSNALLSNTIGASNAAIALATLFNNKSGSNNTASGVEALFTNTTGASNTAVGLSALSTNTTGGNNTAVGSAANVSVGDINNATAIGAGAIVNASNKIRLGNAAVTVIEGQVDFTFPSDQTQKEHFQPVDGEEVLRKLRGVSVTSWNYVGHDPKAFRHYGPMWQAFFDNTPSPKARGGGWWLWRIRTAWWPTAK